MVKISLKSSWICTVIQISTSHIPSIQKIPSKFFNNFLSYPANR